MAKAAAYSVTKGRWIQPPYGQQPCWILFYHPSGAFGETNPPEQLGVFFTEDGAWEYAEDDLRGR